MDNISLVIVLVVFYLFVAGHATDFLRSIKQMIEGWHERKIEHKEKMFELSKQAPK